MDKPETQLMMLVLSKESSKASTAGYGKYAGHCLRLNSVTVLQARIGESQGRSKNERKQEEGSSRQRRKEWEG